ncbi:UNVERIFIED_CONTAM: Polyadenylate-binding protein 7 [Sesamum radiatum]|uniref:Polyadenylate-binding protein 7 n=1 Tax=Sesamum radiatum TaxID=300843 RepID=A0AAW2R582_SESRA
MAVAPMVPAASLYVGDLQQDVTDGMLFDAFSEFKSLASVRICRDSATGRSLCYGYVNFISRQDDARRSGIGNVFVKNLSDSIDSMKLQEYFQKFGNILSCKVVTSQDGKSQGYGFVQFESEDSANTAIEKLNGSTLGGKQIYVGKFVRKSDRALPSHEAKYTNLYMKNVDADVSEEVLKEKFSEYGKILSLVISKDENGASRGFGFVNFENPDDAKCAMEALNGSQLGSKVLYVARAQKKSERKEMLRRQFEEKRKAQILKYQASNVYVKNIDDDITDEDLRKHFSQCGTITSAKIMRNDKGLSKGFGFVCFSTPDEANKAVNSFHGFILHRKPLFVAIAQRKEEREAQLKLQPGWRDNGFADRYRPAVQQSAVPSIPNSPTPHRQTRGRISSNVPQGGGPPYALHLQQPIHSMASSKDMSTQQKGSPSVQPFLVAAGPGIEGSDMLSSLLAAASPEQQKQMLGERIYPLVSQHKPDLAAKITGMLLEMDNSELLLLLDSPGSLAAKVEEAVEVLKLSKAKLSNQNSLYTNYLSSGVAVN